MFTRIAIALSLLLATTAEAKPRKHAVAKHDTKWMRDCIRERTSGGQTSAESRTVCRAEQPEDDIAIAKRELAIARAKAKVAKAKARADAAIEACEQAVVDACVAGAAPDGSTDCEDENLKAQFAQCH